ncbi:MAG: sigma 54-interacting transcriptional regulator [Myxococcales bacterium]|nr:sigma 54-interacting transcriptional regulator [Myxococcales bacterium]
MMKLELPISKSTPSSQTTLSHPFPDSALALVRCDASQIKVFFVAPPHTQKPSTLPIPATFSLHSGKWYIKAKNHSGPDIRVGHHNLGSEPLVIDAGNVITFGKSRFVAFSAMCGGKTQSYYQLDELVTTSTNMLAALCDLCFAAPTGLPVLITGESGTGKELAARAIHRLSSVSAGPFVAVNCAALPEALAEAELFGHCRGAFTGALTTHRGLFEQANQGTLFLDEIGELSAPAQAKLLRVLETGEVRRLGSEETIHTNFRLITATHRDLLVTSPTFSFRSDLYYRIGVLNANLPALRHRAEDIPALCYNLLSRTGGTPAISPSALSTLLQYHWPGNVRELRNALLRANARSGGGEITADHLDPVHFQRLSPRPTADDLALWRSRRIAQEFEKHHGHHKLTYQSLGMSKSSFYRWLRTYRTGTDAACEDKHYRSEEHQIPANAHSITSNIAIQS